MRFFEQNCIVKWVILFASLSWFWDFLPENLKLVDKLQIQVFLIICFLVYSFFEGLSQGIFTSVILKFSILANNGQGLKNLKFWCTIFCAPCRLLVHGCTKKKKKTCTTTVFFCKSCTILCTIFYTISKRFWIHLSTDILWSGVFEIIYLLPTFFVVLTIYFCMFECSTLKAKVCVAWVSGL